ncbi:hypothetical protein CDD81_3409 [Ophiocordyceps australis]|uniref:Uncharacterized protein n=1 Tax=Ophiocordyceps australis TaxID=1399860 RepID=A0A2C5XE44_9HYPO|nr:hypothetical protein CDD81_3409 [Ophiocordyceps australis]
MMDRRNKTPSNKSGRRFFIRPSRTLSSSSGGSGSANNGAAIEGGGGGRGHPVFASEAEARQWAELAGHVQRLRGVNAGTGSVDGAYEEYKKIKGACANVYNQVLSFGGGGGGGGGGGADWVQAVREWQQAVEALGKALREGLVASIALCEGNGADEVLEAMVGDGRERSRVVNRMRNASLDSIRSKGAGHIDKFLLRLGFYGVVQREVRELAHLIQAAEAGYAPTRRVHEVMIWTGGDAVLEFANSGDEEVPVLRFCVQASMLAPTCAAGGGAPAERSAQASVAGAVAGAGRDVFALWVYGAARDDNAV